MLDAEVVELGGEELDRVSRVEEWEVEMEEREWLWLEVEEGWRLWLVLVLVLGENVPRGEESQEKEPWRDVSGDEIAERLKSSNPCPYSGFAPKNDGEFNAKIDGKLVSTANLFLLENL